MADRESKNRIAEERALARPAVGATSTYARRSSTSERITDSQRAAIQRSARSARRRFAAEG